jgi:hypothetical protein
MISHPNCQQDHKDDTDGNTYESGFAATALAYADRFCRGVILHLSEKLASQSGKPTHADAVHIILWRSVAERSVSPVLIIYRG